MPVNRSVWHRITSKGAIPGLPCPRCASGKLKLVDDGLAVLEPNYWSAYRNSNDWEPDEVIERWSATLRCDENACGEIVQMIGDTEVVQTEIELPGGQVEWGLEEVLRIQAVFPAPPLFHISDNVPPKVKQQLDLAFRMYWTDVSACVGRLRTAVEALLDHQKVPKEKLTKNGKMHRMDLKERIDAFTGGAVHKDQLQGLRNIGNLGTHGTDDVTDDDLFDAIDVLEFVLTGIFDTQMIKAKAKKLADKKPVT
jgi:hypothetical protein